MLPAGRLCLHTLRADCNGLSIVRMKLKCTFASTRPVQIATKKCNQDAQDKSFASTRPVQIATSLLVSLKVKSIGFASTRPVQIATPIPLDMADDIELCLHTPRADCNCTTPSKPTPARSLPPHAPCRLQPMRKSPVARTLTFASTRPVQIATAIALVKSHKRQDFASTRPVQIATRRRSHPLYSACFASTRPVQIATRLIFQFVINLLLCLHTPRADCNGRNAQNCNMHFSERVLSR